MQTRRYPRTLEEAFGPYARNTLVSDQTPMTAGDKAVITVGLLTFIGMAVSHFFF